MTLTTAYLTTTKNLEGILNSIQSAQAPDKFTTKFLESLGYKTAADRLMIGVLKGLGFIDDASAPTDRYFRFLSPERSRSSLAEGIRVAYDDLFRLNVKAQKLSEAEVKNKLKNTNAGSKKSDTVLDDMAKTFVSLCAFADWTPLPAPESQALTQEKPPEEGAMKVTPPGVSLGQLCYNIQIILPATRDTAVYDAIFKSLKEHLLK